MHCEHEDIRQEILRGDRQATKKSNRKAGKKKVGKGDKKSKKKNKSGKSEKVSAEVLPPETSEDTPDPDEIEPESETEDADADPDSEEDGDPYGDNGVSLANPENLPVVAPHEAMDDKTMILHLTNRHEDIVKGKKLQVGDALRPWRALHMRVHNSGIMEERHIHEPADEDD